MRQFFYALCILEFCSQSSIVNAQTLNYKHQSFTIPATTEQLVIAMINEDHLNDIVSVTDKGLRVYFQREDGFNFTEAFDEINFENFSVGWDLSSGFSIDGRNSILGLVNGTDVYSWQAIGESIQQPELIQSGLSGFLSKGINRV